ncbi:MAG: N-acetylmuramoyl-L-alanine amidase [Rhodobacteraceae bacterium]|nr:N-acetylmuramoyl-L-alanine amidase [Paracoccaceae bacterium]
MSRLAAAVLAAALALCAAPGSPASEGRLALARLDAASSFVRDAGGEVVLSLALSRPVPWRAYTLADPPRLVLDFREIDWRGGDPAAILRSDLVTGLRAGTVRPGWSRLVLPLAVPLVIDEAGMETRTGDGSARLGLRLVPASAEAMRAAAGAPDSPMFPALPEAPPPPRGRGALTVALDPGHGGIDPGAEAGGVTEADLMLAFARDLEAALLRAGFRVALTRDADVFVPLDLRITRARAAGADLLLSLHADAVPEGRATGATVFTLSETASEAAAALLAERHDRDDLLSGVDLSAQDDAVAVALMDIARLDTRPRSEALADAIVAGLGAAVGGLHKRPRQSAGFTVLRAADIPSVLIELGFLTTAADRERLLAPEWRRRAAQAIAQAVSAWAAADAERARQARR